MEFKLGFIGGGNMSSAIINGLLLNKKYTPSQILVSEKSQQQKKHLETYFNVKVIDDINFLLTNSQQIIIGLKPFVFEQLADQQVFSNVELSDQQVVISVMAGPNITRLQQVFNTTMIVRSMPNTPALVNQGITFWILNQRLSVEQKNKLKPQMEMIFSTLGVQIQVENEDMILRGCAIYGSGPGYVHLFSQALKDASVKIGFTNQDSERLVKQLIYGVGLMYSKNPDMLIEQFKTQVVTPQGTTIQGISAFEQAGIRSAAMKAVQKAYNKQIIKPKL